MDKSILKEYTAAKEMLKAAEADLEKVKQEAARIQSDSVKGSNPVFPYQAMTFKVTGIGDVSYNKSELVKEKERILTERKQYLEIITVMVEEFINEVPPRIQQIIRLRFLEGCTWEQVSFRTGCSSRDGARMTLERFLQGHS